MKRQRMLRFLRSAGSAVSLMACALVIALAVRSYSWREGIDGCVFSHQLMMTSLDGRLRLAVARDAYWSGTRFHCSRLPKDARTAWNQHPSFTLGFEGGVSKDWVTVGMPHWFVVLITGAIAVAPWIKRPFRFSLRSMLIATMVVALGLGIITALT